jgi:hypothetical protein
MIHIISRSDGPRREDAAAKHFLRENALTINKIANQLSGGRIGRQSAQDSKSAEVLTTRKGASPIRDGEKRPYVTVSMNGRVLAVDFNTGRQLHHLGDIRGQGPMRRFVLASEENRFFAPLEKVLVNKLQDLDGMATPSDCELGSLAGLIDKRLGFSNPGDDALTSTF